MAQDICTCRYSEAWEHGEHQEGCPMDDLEGAYREMRAEVERLEREKDRYAHEVDWHVARAEQMTALARRLAESVVALCDWFAPDLLKKGKGESWVTIRAALREARSAGVIG